MNYELDSMIGLDRLELSYEAHVVGFDGECFLYGVYFEDALTEEKAEEVSCAVSEFFNAVGDIGAYIDVTRREEKVIVYLDLGGVFEPADQDMAIKGVLKALDKVEGIKNVLINED